MKKSVYSLLTLLAVLLMVACEDSKDYSWPGNGADVTIGTPVVSEVTYSTAYVTSTVSGSLANMSKKGFCLSTNAEPTIADLAFDVRGSEFAQTVTGLTENTTYYVRAYALVANSVIYSDAVSFTTDAQSEEDKLSEYICPSYPDNYLSVNGWSTRAQWNLANVHDPSVMLADDGYYYMYQTDASYGNSYSGHGHFFCRRSKNLVDWEFLGATMQHVPSWIQPKLNEIRAAMGLGPSTANFNDDNQFGYWAPCVRKVRSDLYRMYYVITMPGTLDGDGTWSERCFIGLMETATPANVSSWVDKGYVITNYSDRNLNFNVAADNWGNCYYKYNAIDPSYIITENGEHWLIYGSWHSGFAAVQINAETGKTITELPMPWGAENEVAYGTRVFTRHPTYRWQGSEAPEVVYRDGWYYLFAAYDGLDVPYNTRVVRSRNITGPYVGMNGTDVTRGGEAYPIVTHPYKFSDDQGWVGISHCAIFDDGKGNWFYASQQRFPADVPNINASNAIMLGGVRSIIWTEDGWPLVMPERYGAVPQPAIAEEELIGAWEHIPVRYSSGNMCTSVNITLNANHKVSGAYFNGSSWNYDAEKRILSIGTQKLYLSREVDWEASPRKVTIVYAGYASGGTTTYWGKKK